MLKRFSEVLIAVLLCGCAITIQKPAQNETVQFPSRTQVIVTGNASYSGLKVNIDGVDVSARMDSAGVNRHEGIIRLPAGAHMITATAEVDCSYCSGSKTQSTDTNSFVVNSTSGCVVAGGAPVTTLPTSTITVGQQAGRKTIGYLLKNGKAIRILVDDAPGLRKDQMRLELDIDPDNVKWSKAIEASTFCRRSPTGVVVASSKGGFGVGVICSPLTAANDFRSGCTNTQTILLNESTTSELWLRGSGFFGNWSDAEAIDSSFWDAFGGRSVRFIWMSD